jgi:tetratricopeptide (TPR) repeat protein
MNKMIMKTRLFKIIFLFFLLITSKIMQAQSFDSVMNAAKEAEFGMKEKIAFQQYVAAQKIKPADPEALYKCSELASRIGNREASEESRNRYYQTALAYARQMVKLHPQNDQSHLALSIALGRIALTKSGKEKVSTVKEIKQAAETAVKINAANYKAWHVLGKWYYEVSNLNMLERAAIKLFFGGMPDASFSKAIQCYEKAKSIQPNFNLNHLELAKSYYKNDEETKALNILTQITSMHIRTEDDTRIRKEAQTLYQSWK